MSGLHNERGYKEKACNELFIYRPATSAHLKFESLISASQLGQKYFSNTLTCFTMHERQTVFRVERGRRSVSEFYEKSIIYGNLFLKQKSALHECMHVLIVVASIRYPLHRRQVRILLKFLTRFLVIILVAGFTGTLLTSRV